MDDLGDHIKVDESAEQGIISLQQLSQHPVEAQADAGLDQSGADPEIDQHARIGSCEGFVYPHKYGTQESGGLVGLPHLFE